ncbi:MAG: molybdate ABC transporter substrate-binding protein [SAR202 cluster bacterium Io17-Chloro-G6]|nr:MAG: molybdate ABC transporter substrate-binding protein [SAR202 cluster bacterium Io17-Chloro-G6]
MAFFLFVNCGGDNGTTVRVLAASSLTEAFTDVARAFEAEHPGVKVRLDFGGSQRLRSQLEFGAEADVFASADYVQMDQVAAAGLVKGVPVNFATNSLVMIATQESGLSRLADLARSGVKLALAHAGVPVGSYSRQVLRNLSADGDLGLESGFDDDVLANLVSEEPNVRLVAQKVALGQLDAGIVYQTDVPAAEVVGEVRVIPIPARTNVSARYPIAVLQDAPEADLAHAFVRFVLSKAGQRHLEVHGFGSP